MLQKSAQEDVMENSQPVPKVKINGIKFERVVNREEKVGILSFFKCQICSNLARNPQIERKNCQSTFCSKCLIEWTEMGNSNCPMGCLDTYYLPLNLIEQISMNELIISCKNKKRGCTQELLYNELEGHESTCTFSPIKCTAYASCHAKGGQDFVKDHEKTCEFLKVGCQKCGMLLKRKEIETHSEISCLWFLIKKGEEDRSKLEVSFDNFVNSTNFKLAILEKKVDIHIRPSAAKPLEPASNAPRTGIALRKAKVMEKRMASCSKGFANLEKKYQEISKSANNSSSGPNPEVIELTSSGPKKRGRPRIHPVSDDKIVGSNQELGFKFNNWGCLSRKRRKREPREDTESEFDFKEDFLTSEVSKLSMNTEESLIEHQQRKLTFSNSDMIDEAEFDNTMLKDILEGFEKPVKVEVNIEREGSGVLRDEKSARTSINILQCELVGSFGDSHKDPLKVIELTDGNICTSYGNGLLKNWNFEKRLMLNGNKRVKALIKCSKRHKEWIYALIQLKNGVLVTGANDANIKFTDPSTLISLGIFNGHKRAILDLVELPECRLASSSVDKDIIIWDLRSKSYLYTLSGHSMPVLCLTYIGKDRLVSGSEDCSIVVWSLKNQARILSFELESPIRSLAEIGETKFASGTDNGKIQIWNLEKLINKTPVCILTLHEHSSYISKLLLINEEQLMSSSGDATIKVWNTKSGECLKTFGRHSTEVVDFAVLRRGGFVSISENTINYWR